MRRSNFFKLAVRLDLRISETPKGKLSLGAKILWFGGVRKVFNQKFNSREGKKLTEGPVAGLLFGSTDTCHGCDFDLHKACAVAVPSNIFTHPFYPRCEFKLYYCPPGPGRRRCDGCQKEVLGFTYHCKRCDFDLHSCCANLPQVLNDGENNLYLSHKFSYTCHHCGGKGMGWSYRSENKLYNLHVSCVKELLLESWQATYFNVDKNKVRNLQTDIPKLKGPGARRSGGNVSKKAGVVIRTIVSAVLGDPTAILVAAIGGFFSL